MRSSFLLPPRPTDIGHAEEAYTDLYPVARQVSKDGKTLLDIANHLNADGYTTTG